MYCRSKRVVEVPSLPTHFHKYEVNALFWYLFFKGTLTIAIDVESITFKDAQNRDPTKEEEVKRRLMSEMTKKFFETRADKIPVKDIPHHLCNYLEGILDLSIRTVHEGSLIITVECPTLEILERLWEDYFSGHLNAVVEECLVTDDIRRRFHVEFVRLKTTILEEEYLMCKLSLMSLIGECNTALILLIR